MILNPPSQQHEPVEGIFRCSRCACERPFVTTSELAGRGAPDAPLYCIECDWEIEPPVDIFQRWPEPPVFQRGQISAEVRRIGAEKWRQRLLEMSAPRRRAPDEAPPIDHAALALQIQQLAGERGRRLA